MKSLPSIQDLPVVPYGYTGTTARFDEETGTFFNEFGDTLRDPDEYNDDSEGYTPFGDE